MNEAMRKLTEYAQAEMNRRGRELLDRLTEGLPPPPPMTWRRRASLWLENVREDIAEGLRKLADRIDPWA